MSLEGGVAGAQPLHKGGRLRPTALSRLSGPEPPEGVLARRRPYAKQSRREIVMMLESDWCV